MYVVFAKKILAIFDVDVHINTYITNTFSYVVLMHKKIFDVISLVIIDQ